MACRVRRDLAALASILGALVAACGEASPIEEPAAGASAAPVTPSGRDDAPLLPPYSVPIVRPLTEHETRDAFYGCRVPPSAVRQFFFERRGVPAHPLEPCPEVALDRGAWRGRPVGPPASSRFCLYEWHAFPAAGPPGLSFFGAPPLAELFREGAAWTPRFGVWGPLRSAMCTGDGAVCGAVRKDDEPGGGGPGSMPHCPKCGMVDDGWLYVVLPDAWTRDLPLYVTLPDDKGGRARMRLDVAGAQMSAVPLIGPHVPPAAAKELQGKAVDIVAY